LGADDCSVCLHLFLFLFRLRHMHMSGDRQRYALRVYMYIYISPIWWNSAAQPVPFWSLAFGHPGVSKWFLTFADAFCFRTPSIFPGYCITHAAAKITPNSQLMSCVRHFNLGLQHVLMSWHFQKWMKCIAETGHLSSLSRLIYGPEYLDSREANGGGGS